MTIDSGWRASRAGKPPVAIGPQLSTATPSAGQKRTLEDQLRQPRLVERVVKASGTLAYEAGTKRGGR